MLKACSVRVRQTSSFFRNSTGIILQHIVWLKSMGSLRDLKDDGCGPCISSTREFVVLVNPSFTHQEIRFPAFFIRFWHKFFLHQSGWLKAAKHHETMYREL